MEDHFAKSLRLFGSIFLSVVGFFIAIALLLLGLRLFFGLLSYIPWITYLYLVLILLLPVLLFTTAYIIYFKRTALHPSQPVRFASYTIFSIALIAWVIFFILDMRIFFMYGYPLIEKYHSYNLLFLAMNVACFFLVGVIQAFTTVKEKDWLDRQVH